LERTKTSGLGKTLTVLPCFVSEAAYVLKPWLDVVFLLWSESPLDYPWDYFPPPPTEDFRGCLQERALYSDSAGFSRALLGTLRRPDGTALLSGAACRFWTEYSDRAGLDGWCMALAVPEPERSFLGRWATKGSTDAYVRTAVRRTYSCLPRGTRGPPQKEAQTSTARSTSLGISAASCWMRAKTRRASN